MKEITPEVVMIKQLLDKRLTDEPSQLINDLENIEAWNGRAGYLLAQANSWLDQMKAEHIPSKEGRTEFDRKIILDAKIAPVRLVRDKLDSLCNAIKTRITLGQSLLAYMRQSLEAPKHIGNPH